MIYIQNHKTGMTAFRGRLCSVCAMNGCFLLSKGAPTTGTHLWSIAIAVEAGAAEELEQVFFIIGLLRAGKASPATSLVPLSRAKDLLLMTVVPSTLVLVAEDLVGVLDFLEFDVGLL